MNKYLNRIQIKQINNFFNYKKNKLKNLVIIKKKKIPYFTKYYIIISNYKTKKYNLKSAKKVSKYSYTKKIRKICN